MITHGAELLIFAVQWSDVWGRGEVVYTGFWWGNVRDRDHLGDPGVDGRITVR
jgi:hypothetical protein